MIGCETEVRVEGCHHGERLRRSDLFLQGRCRLTIILLERGHLLDRHLDLMHETPETPRTNNRVRTDKLFSSCLAPLIFCRMKQTLRNGTTLELRHGTVGCWHGGPAQCAFNVRRWPAGIERVWNCFPFKDFAIVN